ncbi:MAG: zf-HC2 domain-containing protein [Actinocrinis sp.]
MTDRAPQCIAGRDSWQREAVGAYLLGALEPAESDQVSAHLAACVGCRAEYGELTELLPLLASVSESEAVNGPVRPEPAVLGRVLESTARQAPAALPVVEPQHAHRRPWRDRLFGSGSGTGRRPLHTRVALAAGAAVLVVGGVGAGLAMSTSNAAAAGWSASASANGGWTGDTAAIDAWVQVTQVKVGSDIQLKMDHVTAGYVCTMVIVGENGERQTGSTWRAPSDGSFTISGTASMPPNQIASVQVELPDGHTLLTLDSPRSSSLHQTTS